MLIGVQANTLVMNGDGNFVINLRVSWYANANNFGNLQSAVILTPAQAASDSQSLAAIKAAVAASAQDQLGATIPGNATWKLIGF